MSDKDTAGKSPAPRNRKRSSRNRVEEQPAVQVAVNEATVEAEKNVRDGGATLSPDQLLFSLNGSPVVFDAAALSAIVAAIDAAYPDGTVDLAALSEPFSAPTAPLFVPPQRGLLKGVMLPRVPAPGSFGKLVNAPVVLPQELHEEALPGLYVVVGPTASGKSEVIAKWQDAIVIRFGEPAEAVDAAPNVVQARDLLHALNLALVISAMGAFPVIDSLRTAVFSLAGNTGPGGVSVALYDMLTDISNLFARLGCCFAAAVNPMSNGDREELIQANIAASVTGMLLVSNAKVASITARTLKRRYFGEPLAGLGEEASQPRGASRSHERFATVAQDDPSAPLLDGDAEVHLDSAHRRTGRRII